MARKALRVGVWIKQIVSASGGLLRQSRKKESKSLVIRSPVSRSETVARGWKKLPFGQCQGKYARNHGIVWISILLLFFSPLLSGLLRCCQRYRKAEKKKQSCRICIPFLFSSPPSFVTWMHFSNTFLWMTLFESTKEKLVLLVPPSPTLRYGSKVLHTCRRFLIANSQLSWREKILKKCLKRFSRTNRDFPFPTHTHESFNEIIIKSGEE